MDDRGRPALYTTVSAQAPNRLRFQLSVTEDGTSLSMNHVPSNTLLATWDLFHIVGKFVTKFERMLFVHADSRRRDGTEEFHFNRTELLAEPSSLTFRDGFASGMVTIDVRMHLRPNGSARNHGTAFRIHEHDLPMLFGRTTRIV